MQTSRLRLQMRPQPDDSTCGPTCLHAVYQYFGDDVALEEVVRSAPRLPGADAGRGTLAVMLGCDALARGYDASLYTFNLNVFDPTWFPRENGPGDPELLRAKLREQARFKGEANAKLAVATVSYLEFLDRGGRIFMRDMNLRLLSSFLKSGRPVLTGLSSTALYRSAREFGDRDDEDDVRGEPVGHFAVLCGYDAIRRRVRVADPLEDNPRFDAHVYDVDASRLIASILLGVLTYDANLLVIEPRAGRAESPNGAGP